VPTTATPTDAPTTATPTDAPTTATPTDVPTTATPTDAPTTATPTDAPTTATPTNAPTTAGPTDAPTEFVPEKTGAPSEAPTTTTPTFAPIFAPTFAPSASPTPRPTSAPSQPPCACGCGATTYTVGGWITTNSNGQGVRARDANWCKTYGGTLLNCKNATGAVSSGMWMGASSAKYLKITESSYVGRLAQGGTGCGSSTGTCIVAGSAGLAPSPTTNPPSGTNVDNAVLQAMATKFAVDFNINKQNIGSMYFQSGPCKGRTVSAALAEAQRVFAGSLPIRSSLFGDIPTVVVCFKAVNENFDNGVSNNGLLCSYQP
jgi:hypothetical protein